MPRKKNSSSAETRQRLIDASYRLITTRGYHATSMRDIASEAGITAGSIYNHFSDKGEIVKAVLFVYHPIVKVMPVLEQTEGDSLQDLVRDASRRMMHEVDTSPGILNLLYIELVELNGAHIDEMVATMYPLVDTFLKRIYASGEQIRPADPLTFFRAFIGHLLAYRLTQAAPNSTVVTSGVDASLDDFIEIFLNGVLV
ncbi:MAG: TetR/AcrR family transcriptional regulator [Chloroflexota bacterium]